MDFNQVKSHTIHRKTKKGTIIKIVREHYLRRDIPCGVKSCQACQENISAGDCIKNPLSMNPRNGISSLIPDKHFVIPDSEVILAQIDVLEDVSFGSDVIILQTVLNDVRQKSLKIYTRLRALTASESRSFHVFCNEFHHETYSDRLPGGETLPNYRNRLIDITCRWFNVHLETTAIKAFVLNSGQAPSDKANWVTFLEYIKGLKDGQKLLEKVFIPGVESNDPSSESLPKDLRFMYPDHQPLPIVLAGLKKGSYFSGKYRANRSNYLEGSVSINQKGKEMEVLIQDRMNINRALDTDTVAIEILPEDLWVSKSDVALEPGQDEEEVLNKMKSDEKMGISETIYKKKMTGRVVAIIKRNWRQICGSLKKRDDSISKTIVFTQHLFVPKDSKIPLIRIESRQYELLKDQRILVTIDSWPKDSKYPKGHYIRALGPIGDKNTEKEALLLDHDIPFHSFSENVIKCLPKDAENWKIPQEEYEKRTDLRDEIICSVDPPGCTDIDDALHSKDLGGGTFEVGVHIADVSYFVKTGSALDLEAANRGTTVYLVNTRIDMIPALLSSNLCSLREGVERLTFSVVWVMDSKTADIKGVKFFRSVIKSRAAMTYAEAQAKLDQGNMKDQVTASLFRLNSLAKKLKQKRINNGALVLANQGEIKFIEVESETHDNVMEIQAKQMMETNSMIEEFMLLANVAVAERIHSEFPEISLLRRHPQPSVANFDELKTAIKRSTGFDIDASTGKSLSESLDACVDRKNPMLNMMIRMLVTRCMSQAVYFCSGNLDSDDNIKHYGLAADIYTHFTSPIRRYADLMVHRMLSFAIGSTQLESGLLNKDKIQAICENINKRHKNAQYASRASSKLHTIDFIKRTSKKRLIQEAGYVLNVMKNNMAIFIPALALELPYWVREAEWRHELLDMKQTHVASGTSLGSFSPVTIQLGIVDRSTDFKRGREEIDIRIVSPPIDEPLVFTKKLRVK